MIKADFVKLVQTKLSELRGSSVTAIEAEQIISVFTEATLDVIKNGDSIVLPNYGKFHPAFRKGKTGKIPGTDKTYTSEDKYVPKLSFADAAVKEVIEANNK